MRLLWAIRLAYKWCWWYGARGWGLLEYCHICGRAQPLTWHVSDELWHAVIDDSPLVLCPECFDSFARERGYLICWEGIAVSKTDKETP